MSKRTITSIAVACLVVGIFAGGAAAQIVQYKVLNSGLTTVNDHETIKFHFTLEDKEGMPPAIVQMQLLNETGSVVASKIVTLDPGHSATLEDSSAGLRRAHADIVDAVSQVTTRRAAVGTVEVHDTLTKIVRPVCSPDVGGAGGGRN